MKTPSMHLLPILALGLLLGGCASTLDVADQRMIPVPEMVSWYVGSCDSTSNNNACIQEVPSGWAMLSPGVSIPGPSRELWSATARRNLVVKRHETTQGEWRDMMSYNPSFFKDCGDDCPVERVSWWDVLEYLNRLSVRDGLPPCYEM
ncbi:MAG: hypothetical protein VX938_04945, partial [Myxococcota bacterium]|nr:hypothetical protein [Myxococcota bacterium]